MGERATNAEMVREFHQAFNVPVMGTPAFPPQARIDLCLNHIKEELDELQEAVEQRDLVEVADALADLIYVTYSKAFEFGIPIDAVFAEVHASNMRKLDADGRPILRADGKILKPADWTPPDIAAVLGGDAADASAL